MIRLFFISMCLVISAGCGEFEKLDLHPVTGSVSRMGEPVKAGSLIFLQENPGPKAMTINASVRDGKFEATTDRTSRSGTSLIVKGVPAGRYKVEYHPDHDGSREGMSVDLPPVDIPVGGKVINFDLPEKMPEGVSRRPGHLLKPGQKADEPSEGN